jgi:hypothetical protein
MDVMEKVLEVMLKLLVVDALLKSWILCNYVMLTELGIWQVKSEDAVKMARELAVKEGLLVSEANK